MTGHIPPGAYENGGWFFFSSSKFNDDFLQSFEGYNNVVIAHLYGHQHTETFRLTKDNGPMFVTTTLSPANHHEAI